jgi:hypothetical protein
VTPSDIARHELRQLAYEVSAHEAEMTAAAKLVTAEVINSNIWRMAMLKYDECKRLHDCAHAAYEAVRQFAVRLGLIGDDERFNKTQEQST